MNILYISQITGAKWAGPTHSVPRQIRAQAEYDNVFWYNIRKFADGCKKEADDIYPVHTTDEYPELTVKALPAPFNKPDLIVFEQFYGFGISKIVREVKNSKIPYIIIPRGEFTKRAQKRKALKKKIANIFYFHSIANNAAAIQYLTEDEKNTSGNYWNENYLVIPNGIDLKMNAVGKKAGNNFTVSYIGRIEKYQKGLDLLLDALNLIKEEIIKNKVKVNIYGPDVENQVLGLKKQVEEIGLQRNISFNDGVFGKEKEDILRNSDVFIMTSRFEGHPMSMIEALSYGIPCFATTGTNMSEEIAEYNAGWSSKGDVESIKKNLLKMISERKNLELKKENALKLAGLYDWDYLAKITHEKYESLLAGI